METTSSISAPRKRRPRPQLVTLTDAAAVRVREILSEREQGYLRVGVKNGGCAGMEYVLDYVADISPMDEVVFRNPNQTDACGCGESVTIVPVVEA